MQNLQTIILASQSPRRLELLKQINVNAIVKPADIDESIIIGENPEEYVLRLARLKALTVFSHLNTTEQATLVLAADTTVTIENIILGKPLNVDDAKIMLQTLSGRVHYVHTAIAVCNKGKVDCLINTTMVEMMPLSESMINVYIDSREPFDKAGAYGIQGQAGAWIKRIEGSYTGVMGLPLYETALLLKRNA
jgi:septum formation protein